MPSEHHLQVLTEVALAARLGVSTWTLQRRTDRPRPLCIAGRNVYFLDEVAHLLPPPRPYTDEARVEEVAAALGCTVQTVYKFVRDGMLPRPHRRHPRREQGGRGASVWSRRDCEAHLKALPRGQHG